MSTGIEWTDETWNPITGCTKVSPGCDHCYAETFAERFRGVPDHHFERGFDITLRPERLNQPLQWKKPRRIFVNSMSDLFHDDIPDSYIAEVFAVMALAPQHTFQVLTKRHGRMRSLMRSADFRSLVDAGAGALYLDGTSRVQVVVQWPLPNVWVGVSVEDQRWADIRIPKLLDTPAAVRFLSCEPLLGPVDLAEWLFRPPGIDGWTVPWAADNRPIDWVIVGGESGPGARPMHPDWARNLRDQCRASDVPFLFKQWGAWAPHNVARPTVSQLDYHGTHWDGTDGAMARVGKKAAGRELDGRTWDEYPQPVPA